MSITEYFTVASLISFLTLTILEIVLGIDNIIFVSILVEKLPKENQKTARLIGLGLALILRVVLLFFITWIAQMVSPLFTVFEKSFSGRDLILMGGGLFLLAKSTLEIHDKLEGEPEHETKLKKTNMLSAVAQIAMLDIVFSLDSVITAVGLANELPIMIAAVVIAVLVMLLTAEAVHHFIHRHPTIKMLALSFLLMVGLVLTAEGFGAHVPKGYIYFAMAFSVFVEMLNLRIRKKSEAGKHSKPVVLRGEPRI